MAASGRRVAARLRAIQAARAAAAEHWQDFVETISTLHLERAPAGPPNSTSPAAGMRRIWNSAIEDAAQREADLTQLAQIAASYPTRERFLTELTLDPPDATSDEAGVAAAR